MKKLLLTILELNNYLMLVSGTCKKINCENRDNKLVILSNSIVW